MKRFTFLLLSVLFFTSFGTNGQSIAVSSYVEQTKISPKIGTSLGLKWTGIYPSTYGCRYSIEVGAFYQRETSNMQTGELTSQRERNFTGIYLESPLIYHDVFTLNMNIRTGIQNGEYFLITPALKTRFIMSEQLSFGLGLGARTFQPTVLLDFKISL